MPRERKVVRKPRVPKFNPGEAMISGMECWFYDEPNGIHLYVPSLTGDNPVKLRLTRGLLVRMLSALPARKDGGQR